MDTNARRAEKKGQTSGFLHRKQSITLKISAMGSFLNRHKGCTSSYAVERPQDPEQDILLTQQNAQKVYMYENLFVVNSFHRIVG